MPKTRRGEAGDAFKKRLGKHIAAVRQKAQLQGNELAERIGVRPGSLTDWEKGRKYPSLENLVSIARETKGSVAFLLSDALAGASSLEVLSRDLGAALGARRMELLLSMPDRRLQRTLDVLIGEFLAEGGELQPRTPRRPARPRS